MVFEFRNFATALSKQRRLLGGRVPPEIVPPGMAPDKGPKRGTISGGTLPPNKRPQREKQLNCTRKVTCFCTKINLIITKKQVTYEAKSIQQKIATEWNPLRLFI